MSVELPARPQKGQIVPHDYFQRMWDHARSLEPRGDLNTTTVKRDRSGSVITAYTQGGDGTAGRIGAIIAQVDADNSDGTYTATEQKNAAGTFSDRDTTVGMTFDNGSTENGFLYELNGIEGVPVGTFVVVHRVANTSGGPIWYFDSGYDGRSFWAKLTGETSGDYSWTELEGDASTTTARTGTTNAQEVSGRLGIPDNSIVRMFPHPTDNTDFQFEYHGANSGTVDALLYSDQAAAHTDDWDRVDQAALRGVKYQFMTRMRIDATTGEVRQYDRRETDGANGHGNLIDAEAYSVVGVSEPSTETYEYVDCATGLTTIARISADDYISEGLDDYLYMHDGSDNVKSYNDGLSAGAATSPLPCFVMMPTTPANCAAVNISAFDEDFADAVDPCRTDLRGPDGTGTVTGGKYEISIPSNSGVKSHEVRWNLPLGTGEFTVTADISSLDLGTPVTTFNECYMTIRDTSLAIVGVVGRLKHVTVGDFRFAQSDVTAADRVTTADSSTSGTIEASRDGADLLSLKYGGVTILSYTETADIGRIVLQIAFTNNSAGVSVDFDDVNFSNP